MKSPIGLWSLILLYTLVSISVKLHSAPAVQVSDCIESCFSVDTNEVDHGQISHRTKLGTSGFNLHEPTTLKVLSISDYPDYVTKLKFVFLDIHPSFQFAQESFRPPIYSSPS